MNSGLISTSPFFVPPFRLFLLPCNPGKPLYLRFSGRNPKFNRDLVTTRFRLILPVHSHNVTKNLTGHRIHLEGPQIYQINRQTNSFQNMCDMLKAKVDRLARKIEFVQQEHLKTGSFGEHESGLPDFGRPWTPNG